MGTPCECHYFWGRTNSIPHIHTHIPRSRFSLLPTLTSIHSTHTPRDQCYPQHREKQQEQRSNVTFMCVPPTPFNFPTLSPDLLRLIFFFPIHLFSIPHSWSACRCDRGSPGRDPHGRGQDPSSSPAPLYGRPP